MVSWGLIWFTPYFPGGVYHPLYFQAGCGATLRKQVAGQLCSSSLSVGGTVTKRFLTQWVLKGSDDTSSYISPDLFTDDLTFFPAKFKN